MAEKTFGERVVPILSAVLVVLLVLSAASQYMLQRSERAEAARSAYLSHQAVLAQGLAGQSAAAAGGDLDALDRLSQLGEQLERLPSESPPGLAAEALADVERARSQAARHLTELLATREALLTARDSAAAVRQLIPQLLGEVGNLAGLLGPADRAALAPHIERLELAGQRAQQDMVALAAGVDNITHVAQRLSGGDDYMRQVVRGLAGEDTGLGIAPVRGRDATTQLEQLQALYSQVSERIRAGVGAANQLIVMHSASDRLISASQSWYGAAQSLLSSQAAEGLPQAVRVLPLFFISAALLVFLGFVTLYRGASDARRLAETQAGQNERNQQAILRLLDELGSLADGDLTVEATVTEDITGAIADSINYAVEALRGLVATIERSAIQIDAAAHQTQASAAHLAKASENQSQQVSASTEAIANMAGSIEEVSGNAERSADVARHSVDVAHKGGEAVRRTIEGMNTIRETIQETSKRIKRLGESSQEIGNIVELINDIAEQTNILALNASIQASMAGEAGRGFAVVADEVQRLAERSANATKQIEVLVHTIQSDTNEAVISMERSTTDVVSGALLAENAGASLDEIEKVSNQIASLVQNISATSRQQATAAAGMARNMGVLQEISAQTAESTGATSAAIGKLAQLAGELRRSVAGFTLPESESKAEKRSVAEPDEDEELTAPPAASIGAR